MKYLLFASLCTASSASSLWSTISSLPNAKTFTEILSLSGMDTLLDGSDQYTVFVPTDQAFSASWPPYLRRYVFNEPGSARQFAQYAVHEGVLPTSAMHPHMNVTTLHPYHNLFVQDADADQVHLNDATCGVGGSVKANLPADNGVFHLVDTVFQPPAAVCPDKIVAAEQRSQARITSYGYECRSKNETRHLYISANLKPVGLAVDDTENMVFWANDQDYPRRSPTSWISKMFYNETGKTVVNDTLIDPQGVFADANNKRLYFASHSGYAISRMFYNGSGLESVYSQPGNLSFQPSDVVVDTNIDTIFFSVEGTDTVSGSLWSVKTDGTNATQLLPNKNYTQGLIQNYGLCLDDHKQHVYWVQGGNGGSIHCFAYGDKFPCEKETIIDDLSYPYMCDVDNAFAKYGGPTRIAWSEANRPGSIYYAWENGTDKQTVQVVVSTDLDAPMGIAFSCSPY